MKSPKIILLISILAIFSLIFLASCTLQKQGALPTQEDVRTGTDGLVMEFLSEAPPAKVFSAEDNVPDSGLFQTVIKVSNKGASDVISGIIALTLETGYVNDIGKKWTSTDPKFSERGTQNFVTFSIEGKKPENPAGDIITFAKILQAKIPKADLESQTRKSTVIATACYDYKTSKTASICIEPAQFAEKIGPRPCTVKDITFDSQGAPLAITKVSPRMVSKGSYSTIELLIYIKNKGNGQIVPYNKIATACEPVGGDVAIKSGEAGKTIQKFWNTLNEEDFKMEFSTEQGNFQCGPFPMMLTGKDEDFIRCVYQGTITGTQAYTTTLNLEFRYGYTQSISKDITIERPPQIASQ